MAQQIERLARFAAETTLEQVPKEVQRHAKLVVLDTITPLAPKYTLLLPPLCNSSRG
jgi:hypothetical protein